MILCSQLEDMSGLELLTELRTTEARPPVLMIDEARRQNSSEHLAISIIRLARITEGENPNSTASSGTAAIAIYAWERFPLPKSSIRIISTRVMCAPDTAVI